MHSAAWALSQSRGVSPRFSRADTARLGFLAVASPFGTSLLRPFRAPGVRVGPDPQGVAWASVLRAFGAEERRQAPKLEDGMSWKTR